MSEADILSRLTSLMQAIFEDETLVARRELRPQDVDAWDSVNHLKLIIESESAFGVRFASGEIGRIMNVGDLVDLIRGRLPRQSP